jgi:hypothetical protein
LRALESRLTSYGLNKYYYGRPIRKLPRGYVIFTNRGGPPRMAFAFASDESGAELRHFVKTGKDKRCEKGEKACVVVCIPTSSWLNSKVQDVGSFFGF